MNTYRKIDRMSFQVKRHSTNPQKLSDPNIGEVSN